jgi:cytochrome P450
VGKCPFHVDPDRDMPDKKAGGAVLSFSDGRHRCPGAYIAMHESAIFLSKLVALPNLRVVGKPDVRWNDLFGTYEFHKCVVATG